MQLFSRRPYEDAMSQPLIGITTHASDAEHRDALDRLSRQIVQAVEAAGGLPLAGWALTEQKPFFGICRGLQILNVACGGSLYRDIAEYPGAQRHTFYPDFPFDRLSHPIEIAPESQLARIVGRTTLDINSL